jgi:hypothetical protein
MKIHICNQSKINECINNQQLPLDFERTQTSAFFTDKAFAVWQQMFAVNADCQQINWLLGILIGRKWLMGMRILIIILQNYSTTIFSTYSILVENHILAILE